MRILCLLFLSLLLSLSFVWGQGKCNTQFSPQQIEQLKSESDRGSDFRGMFVSQDLVLGMTDIPIKFHAVRNSQGDSVALTPSKAQQLVEDLNRIFLQARIRFVQYEGIEHIDKEKYFLSVETYEKELIRLYNMPKVLNIYYVKRIEKGKVAGYLYNDTKDRIANEQDCIIATYESIDNGSTLPHEVGHYFGLLHTHGDENGNIEAELVDRTNCHNTGDLICDTPADPNLWDLQRYCTPDCQYTGTKRDRNGELYTPPLHNYMSYNPYPECRTEFTPGQFGHISYYMREKRAYLEMPKSSQEGRTSIKGTWSFTRIKTSSLMRTTRDQNLFAFVDSLQSGEKFVINASNISNQDIYAYVINMDARNQSSILYPYPKNAQTNLLKANVLSEQIPPRHAIQLDASIGLETTCMLFSRQALDIDKLEEDLAYARGSFIERLYAVFGNRLVPQSEVTYSGNVNMKFEAKLDEHEILPVIVQMHHIP